MIVDTSENNYHIKAGVYGRLCNCPPKRLFCTSGNGCTRAWVVMPFLYVFNSDMKRFLQKSKPIIADISVNGDEKRISIIWVDQM